MPIRSATALQQGPFLLEERPLIRRRAFLHVKDRDLARRVAVLQDAGGLPPLGQLELLTFVGLFLEHYADAGNIGKLPGMRQKVHQIAQ